MEEGVMSAGAAAEDSDSDSDWEEYEQCDCVDDGRRRRAGIVPYVAVYDDKEAAHARGFFVAGLPLTATIVSAERDTSSVHLFSPYIYSIELTHGQTKWTIERRYGEFQHLHNRMLLHRAAERVRNPVRRLRDRARRARGARGVTSHVKCRSVPAVDSKPSFRLERALSSVTKDRGDDAPPPPAAPDDAQSSPRESDELADAAAARSPAHRVSLALALSSAKPTNMRRVKFPHFPLLPDSVINHEGMSDRKAALENYLQTLLLIPTYRNHPETAEFLEVSRFSFIHNVGVKCKEGLMKKRPGGRRNFIGCKRFCADHCAKWSKRWMIIKDSFVAYVEPDSEQIHCVLLFDKDFSVFAQPQETEGIERGLMICNQQRHLLLKCDSQRLCELWRTAIESAALHGTGRIWLQEHRFGSSFPVRDNSFGQWFVDGRSFMEHAANMIELAREEIFIADWWLSPEIYLKRPMTEGPRWRLDQLLQRKATEGVRIFVLLYKEMEMALGINSLYSKQQLKALHPNIKVMRHPDHVPGTGTYLWAHHEKLICVDQNVAFVGGIDLCYGRWDDHEHRLTDLGSVQFSSNHNLREGGHSLVRAARPPLLSTRALQLSGMRAVAQAVPQLVQPSLDGNDGADSPAPQPPPPPGVVVGDEEPMQRVIEVQQSLATRQESTDKAVAFEAVAAAAAEKRTAERAKSAGEKTKTGSTEPRRDRKRFKLWSTAKVARSRSDSPHSETVGGATRRYTSTVESGSDFVDVVRKYREIVESGQLQSHKQRGDTPPPLRKHKNKLMKAVDNFREGRARRRWRRFSGDDGILGDYEMGWLKLQASSTDVTDLAGGGKYWIGKDYVNFIFKDFTDLDMPYHDFIDRGVMPRMPWHDIHSVVYGAAARDVARHFIQRWNACKVEKTKEDESYPFLVPKSYENVKVPRLFRNLSNRCSVQVLRSACQWSTGMGRAEDSIQQAYLHMIANAKHYIYIENQFFISLINSRDVNNEVCKALCDRIKRAHKLGERFRVYVMLPLMPGFEGQLGATGGSALQAVLHWTYASISRGPNCLFSSLAGEVDDATRYIVFCSLRTHDELTGKLVGRPNRPRPRGAIQITELIYIHSKLIIVDDRCCLIGSANINDRSQAGKRDSEVAVYVEDVLFDASRMDGAPYEAGRFCGGLRKQLMREHLGLLADDAPTTIDVDDPVSDDFYLQTWLRVAARNADIYEKTFCCIPTDQVLDFESVDAYQMRIPLAHYNKAQATEQLKRVQGALVLFPTQFLCASNLAPAITTKEGLAPTALFT